MKMLMLVIIQFLNFSFVVQFARQYSKNDKATVDWLCKQVQWPPSSPANISDLVHLEAMFDTFDLYLWLR